MKERLLGAAVLIVAAVIVIPALLDGSGPSGTVSQEIALPLPAADVAAPARKPVRTHVVEIEPVIPARDETGDSGPSPATPAAADPASKNDGPPEPVPPQRVRPDPARSAAVVVPAPAAAGWAVQVGSFTSESNARRLVEHLKAANYTAFVVRNVVNGRVMFRVRVGPVPDRDRAEMLAERLQADRQQTQLVRHP